MSHQVNESKVIGCIHLRQITPQTKVWGYTNKVHLCGLSKICFYLHNRNFPLLGIAAKSVKSIKVIKYFSVLSCLMLGFSNTYPVAAHKLEIAADVGATLHIQPNDEPRAGETAHTWFALTRKGGKTILLAQCDCQLVIYAEPHIAGEPALLEPTLKPVNAERYQGIPGADITFPKPGIYQLQLTGKPKSGANFQPFQLNFQVTVAASAGGTRKQVQSQQTINDVAENKLSSFPVLAIAIPMITFLGIIFIAWQLPKGTRGRE